MAAPEQRNIDWGSAEVEDATLTVECTGKSPKAWKQRFRSVLALLDTSHNRWGGVHLNRKVTDPGGPAASRSTNTRRIYDGQRSRAERQERQTI